ncbi:flagellar FlbD family protein [Acidipila rosea]|uniref:Flagellar protein FlbD n=1 Tax=Acidipila rosea TaxID=768535 RepID=A0A4R1L9U6_9BACT|nr:flagellar FlbD family protein [Acidipila rosea]MBW4043845.1 flagellar FlbD family protein [Acidobacteriota bacterium]TCK74147.1 flagellar protein FlbD [Acidipila rosea]
MIELTRLNGSALVVNSDLIKYAEASPDTTLTLVNGEKLVVLESCDEVVARVSAHRARLLADAAKLFPAGSAAAIAFASAMRVLDAEQAQQEPSTGSNIDGVHRRRKADY